MERAVPLLRERQNELLDITAQTNRRVRRQRDEYVKVEAARDVGIREDEAALGEKRALVARQREIVAAKQAQSDAEERELAAAAAEIKAASARCAALQQETDAHNRRIRELVEQREQAAAETREALLARENRLRGVEALKQHADEQEDAARAAEHTLRDRKKLLSDLEAKIEALQQQHKTTKKK
jgi:chromosome segregation ATPase